MLLHRRMIELRAKEVTEIESTLFLWVVGWSMRRICRPFHGTPLTAGNCAHLPAKTTALQTRICTSLLCCDTSSDGGDALRGHGWKQTRLLHAALSFFPIDKFLARPCRGFPQLRQKLTAVKELLFTSHTAVPFFIFATG